MPRTILMSKGKEKVKGSVMPVTQDSSDERREASSPERTSAAMPGLIAERAMRSTIGLRRSERFAGAKISRNVRL